MKKQYYLIWIVGLLLLAGCGQDPVAEPGVSAAALEPAAFTSSMIAKHSGSCMDLANGAKNNGAKYWQYGCRSGNNNQKYSFHPVAGKRDIYNIRNLASGKCLDIDGRTGAANGTPVQQWTCHGGVNQQFKLVRDGGFQVIAERSGKCLDVKNASRSDRTPLHQWGCNGKSHQRFTLPGFKAGPAPAPAPSPNPGANGLYVATNGNDGNPGTLEKPFKTIQKCAQVVTAGKTCFIRKGTYRETVTPKNSGRAGAPITFEPYRGEKVTISGADKVSNWTKHNSKMYKASVGWDLGLGNMQVFLNGQAMMEARWPNVQGTPTYTLQSKFAAVKDARGSGERWSIDTGRRVPAGAKGAKISGIPGRTMIGTVTGVSGSRIDFNVEGGVPNNKLRENSPFELWGKLDFLDAPGEYFHEAGRGIMYLQTPKNDDPDNYNVEVKRRRNAFDLENKSYITIKGLTFFAATITTQKSCKDTSSSNIIIDRVEMRYLSHFSGVSDDGGCGRVRGVGLNLNAKGQNAVTNSRFHNSASQIILAGYGGTTRIENNLITHACYSQAANCASIGLGGRGGSVIVKRNTINSSGGAGVYYGRDIGGIKILNNDISDFNILAIDFGATYTNTYYDGAPVEIAYNLVYNGRARTHDMGIYLDNFSHNHTIHHNVVWNVGTGIKLNIASKNNKVYNNTVVSRGASVDSWARPNSPAKDLTMAGTVISNNIFNKSATRSAGINPQPREDHNINANKARLNLNDIFVNPGRNDFRLKKGSLAIDAGRIIDPYTRGYAGRAPDRGAYEYGRTPWTAGSTLK